mmetsp:Transcript_7083/g.16032  ORF Transcript_7083/g.16032 Transcript_7083/m.16032 type:complete len:108 (+) Transcript_7083:68-391(+)
MQEDPVLTDAEDNRAENLTVNWGLRRLLARSDLWHPQDGKDARAKVKTIWDVYLSDPKNSVHGFVSTGTFEQAKSVVDMGNPAADEHRVRAPDEAQQEGPTAMHQTV